MNLELYDKTDVMLCKIILPALEGEVQKTGEIAYAKLEGFPKKVIVSDSCGGGLLILNRTYVVQGMIIRMNVLDITINRGTALFAGRQP